MYAFESNPEAVEFLEQNAEINNVEEQVHVFGGDVAERLPPVDVEADRAIMNLPGSSEEYVELAVSKVKPGGTVHYYSFVEKDLLWEDAEEEVVEIFEKAGAEAEIQESVVCGHYNPAVERVCFDVKLVSVPENPAVNI